MSTLDPQLLEILACPCPQHAPVAEVMAEAAEPDASPGSAAPSATTALRCTRCDTTYPVRDGIPVMLLDEATPGPQGIGADLHQP